MADETLVPVRRDPPFGAPFVLSLAVVSGPGAYSIHRIATAQTVIGRGEGVDWTIDDSEVSGVHVQVEVVGTVCTLIDLGARNGTKLNGKPMKANSRERLRPLDEFEIGKTRILFAAAKFRD